MAGDGKGSKRLKSSMNHQIAETFELCLRWRWLQDTTWLLSMGLNGVNRDNDQLRLVVQYTSRMKPARIVAVARILDSTRRRILTSFDETSFVELNHDSWDIFIFCTSPEERAERFAPDILPYFDMAHTYLILTRLHKT
jgi:hypothetical protein